jgi:hypothetical protein
MNTVSKGIVNCLEMWISSSQPQLSQAHVRSRYNLLVTKMRVTGQVTEYHNHILLSHLRLRSLVFASYDSQRLRWRYSNPSPHWVDFLAPTVGRLAGRHWGVWQHCAQLTCGHDATEVRPVY